MNRFHVYGQLANGVDGIKKPLLTLTLHKLWYLVCDILPMLLYSVLVNHVLINKQLNNLWFIIIGYFSIFLLTTISVSKSKKLTNRLTMKYDIRVKHKLLKQYTALDNDTYSSFHVGDITSRIEKDSVVAKDYFINHILEYWYSVAYVIIVGFILLYYDWRIALPSFIFIPLTFIIMEILGKKSKQASENLWVLQAQCDTFLHSSYQNWKDIKTNNLENAQYDKLDCQYKKIRRYSFLNQLYWHLGNTFSCFQRVFITQLFLYFIGGVLVIKGYSQTGRLLTFINFYGQFYVYIQKIGESIIHYKSDTVSIEKVLEVLNIKIEVKPFVSIKGNDICIDKLRYSYEGNVDFLLDNISFTVKSGKHLAIVGESGSGKSTLVKLLTGQITPQSGNIFIGGIDIQTVNTESVSAKISIIMQEPILFNMTIRDNLLLVNPDATDAELIECCQRASVNEFIESLPDKLDTIIGERGVKLSGGQKQRLSIARAFIQNRDIIIFDESTSALDSEKEGDIINVVKDISKNKTMITIAHRLSTILSCDNVLILKNGAIIAMDTHENLHNLNETYDLLFQNQYISN